MWCKGADHASQWISPSQSCDSWQGASFECGPYVWLVPHHMTLWVYRMCLGPRYAIARSFTNHVCACETQWIIQFGWTKVANTWHAHDWAFTICGKNGQLNMYNHIRPRWSYIQQHWWLRNFVGNVHGLLPNVCGSVLCTRIGSPCGRPTDFPGLMKSCGWGWEARKADSIPSIGKHRCMWGQRLSAQAAPGPCRYTDWVGSVALGTAWSK